MFSIIIPSYNNIKYLKLCLKSINKNSTKNHEIIIHVNEGKDGTLEYIKQNNIKYTFSHNNVGVCTAINTAAKISTFVGLAALIIMASSFYLMDRKQGYVRYFISLGLSFGVVFLFVLSGDPFHSLFKI